MIRESGRVVAIEDDSLWVETIRYSSCSSCSAQNACGHGILNKIGSGRRNHVRVLLQGTAKTDFAVDDAVEFSIPEQLLVRAALIVYIWPLLGLLAGAVLVSQWWSGDFPAFAGAVLGFLLGVAAVRYHALKNHNNADLQPVIIGKCQSASVDSIAINQTV